MKSLVKSPTITLEKLAANQVNGRLSHGPATPEGLERSADSHIRHGFYSKRGGEALRVLGEDPAELDQLLESLRATWQPSDDFQERLVKRLGRAIWRLERSDRVQDSIAVNQVREMSRELSRRIEKGLEGYDDRLDALKDLANAVDKEDFVADRNAFFALLCAFGREPEGRGEQIRALLYQLLNPQGSDDVRDPKPDPEFSIATGVDRAPLREQIGSLVGEEFDEVSEARERERKSRLKDNAPYFRDSAIPPSGEGAGAVFRMEETSFRQVAKFTDLLLRLKAQEHAGERDPQKSRNEGRTHDVIDNKGSALGTHDVDENKGT